MLQIRKKGIKNFRHVATGYSNEYSANDININISDDTIFLSSKTGRVIFDKQGYDLGNIEVYDDTVSGGAETFADVNLFWQRLINLGYPTNGSDVIIEGNFIKHPTFLDFPVTGDSTSLYLAEDTSLLYQWNGSSYIKAGDGGKFIDGTNPADAVYLGGNVGIGKQPTQALDVQGNIGLTGTQITTDNTLLRLEKTSGGFGAVRFDVTDTLGIIGVEAAVGGIDLCDFAFSPSTGYKGSIRWEHRAGLILGGTDQTVGEFQFLDTGDVSFPFTINRNVQASRLGQFMVGGDKPDASAKFQVDSTTQGLLPPTMTEAQRLAIAFPADGLMVVQVDGSGNYESLWIREALAWKRVDTKALYHHLSTTTTFNITTSLTDLNLSGLTGVSSSGALYDTANNRITGFDTADVGKAVVSGTVSVGVATNQWIDFQVRTFNTGGGVVSTLPTVTVPLVTNKVNQINVPLDFYLSGAATYAKIRVTASSALSLNNPNLKIYKI